VYVVCSGNLTTFLMWQVFLVISNLVIIDFYQLIFQEQALLNYQGELERLTGQMKSFQEEMGTDLLSQLTVEDHEEV